MEFHCQCPYSSCVYCEGGQTLDQRSHGVSICGDTENWTRVTKCMFNLSRFLFGLHLPYVETVFQTELLFSISNLSLFSLKFSLKYHHDDEEDKKLLSFDLN